MHYVYDPFPGSSDQAVSHDLSVYQAKYDTKKKKVSLLSNLDDNGHTVRGFFSKKHKPLDVVKSGDILMINAHGSAKRDVIASDTLGTKLLSPFQIAARLKKDGLSKSHREIRLLT